MGYRLAISTYTQHLIGTAAQQPQTATCLACCMLLQWMPTQAPAWHQCLSQTSLIRNTPAWHVATDSAHVMCADMVCVGQSLCFRLVVVARA